MPSKAGSPFIGARRAMPLLPFSVSLISTSKMKSPYSLSLMSQVPRRRPECRIPSLTVHSASVTFFVRSFHSRTVQSLGASSGKSGRKSSSAALGASSPTRTTNNEKPIRRMDMTIPRRVGGVFGIHLFIKQSVDICRSPASVGSEDSTHPTRHGRLESLTYEASLGLIGRTLTAPVVGLKIICWQVY